MDRNSLAPNQIPTIPHKKLSKDKPIYHKLSVIEQLLFQTFIFLIPTNLAVMFFKHTATSHGIIVDYLIPKLYLSDLPLLLILIIWTIRSRFRFFAESKYPLFLGILLITTGLSTLQSSNPIAGIWYQLKILEFGLFAAWLNQHQISQSHLTKPLIFAVTFQSLIGLTQWLQRSSLIGYLFLGETTLKISSNIAKTTLGGELRPLPYGTTPHPNILAGFIAISLLILISLRKIIPTDPQYSRIIMFRNTLTTIIFLIIAMTTLFLTQSLSAVIALSIGILLIRGRHFHANNLIAISVIIIALGLFIAPLFDNSSLTRRLDLINVSTNIISLHPMLGVGPNNFTAVMADFGTVRGQTRFLQPVHNIYLLWIAETGILSLILTVWIFWSYFHAAKKTLPSQFPVFSPLLMLLLIGFADHYPLTLQTGQLLLVLSATLPFVKLRV